MGRDIYVAFMEEGLLVTPFCCSQSQCYNLMFKVMMEDFFQFLWNMTSCTFCHINFKGDKEEVGEEFTYNAHYNRK